MKARVNKQNAAETAREHGAETGLDLRNRRVRLGTAALATTSSNKPAARSNKMPVDSRDWQQKTLHSNRPTASRSAAHQVSDSPGAIEPDTEIDAFDPHVDPDHEYHDHLSDLDLPYDDEPPRKHPRHVEFRVNNHESRSVTHGFIPSITLPEFSIGKDVKHFIHEMDNYLEFYGPLPDSQSARLICSGVKGEAKDILLRYADDQVDTVDKIFRVLNQEFRQHEKFVVNLHQLKQDPNEKVCIFAGKIRRYVRGLGVSEAKFDRVCIDFLKIGALPHIQTRLQQRDPKIFLRAIRIASEAESEKTVKVKPKTETVNHVAVTDNTHISTISEQLKELCALLTTQAHQPQYQRMTQPPKYGKVGNGVRGVCYHCH